MIESHTGLAGWVWGPSILRPLMSVVFITKANVMYSPGHRLHSLTAVTRPTQPSILHYVR